MRKRILSALIALVMFISVLPAYASGDITVYVSLSMHGEIVKDNDGRDMMFVPVELTGKDTYTIDDALREMHKLHYESGEAGYESSEGKYGLGITKLWGDTSDKYGYQVNGGKESVMGLAHEIEDGDYIDAAIYENYFPDTESYTAFDSYSLDAYSGIETEISLYVSGYDDEWNTVFLPCEGAKITINGDETEYVTDDDGKVSIIFEETGEVTISARKQKEIKGNMVTAITAPVCVVNVKESADTMIHNLADMYAEINLEDAGGNLPWIVADLMVYEEIFKTNILSSEKEKEALSLIASDSAASEKPGDLAKAIIAIRALGYDARNIITADFEKVNLVEKLLKMAENGDESVTNIYTLPYVIIALTQEEEYASDAVIKSLIASAVESKDKWQIIDYGTDAMTPMVLALAPYYSDEAVEKVIDDTVKIIKEEQREDGLIDGYEGYESASTSLAICAFSALGIDSSKVSNGGENLIDGLLSTADDNFEHFPNAFADEQGLRGLLAWKLLLADEGRIMYDFSDYPLNDANIPGVLACPVVFDVTPTDAKVSIDGAAAVSGNVFDLASGNYNYTVTASGYNSSSGTFTVTDEEAENNIKKEIKVSLSSAHSGGGGSYEKEKEKEETVPQEPEEEKQFSGNTFPDVSEKDWYYSAVEYAYKNNLFSGTDKGFEPDSKMTRAMLVTVLYRISADDEVVTTSVFEDVKEDKWYAESVNWASAQGIVSGISESEFGPENDITREQLATILYRYALKFGYDTASRENADIGTFSDCDQISEYAKTGISFVFGMGIMTGRENSEFCPKEMATRAEVCSMLMRFSQMIEK